MPNDSTDKELRNPGTIVIAAYARLLELEARRWTRQGQYSPLPPEDEAAYAKLKEWWANFQGNRFRIMELVKNLSNEIDQWSEYF